MAVFLPFVMSGAPCERIGTRDWQWVGIWYPHTCHMDQRTAITTQEFYITSNSDANVQGLFFKFNKKIEFLPENTARKFPNLIVDRRRALLNQANFEGKFQRADKASGVDFVLEFHHERSSRRI